MNDKWIIRFYITESSYKSGNCVYSEIVYGDWDRLVNVIQTRMKNANLKYYDYQQL